MKFFLIFSYQHEQIIFWCSDNEKFSREICDETDEETDGESFWWKFKIIVWNFLIGCERVKGETEKSLKSWKLLVKMFEEIVEFLLKLRSCQSLMKVFKGKKIFAVNFERKF